MGRSRLHPVPLGLGILAVLLLSAVAVLLAPARPAAAHAAVVDTVPQQQAVLGFSPTEVTITFSEPVALVPGRAQVLAPDGKRINNGEATVRDATLRIPIRVADRPLGTYLVSYRVISADSHPVAGSYTFAVGAASATPPEPADETVRPDVRVAVPLTRYLGYAGLVLVIGPALLLGLLWPGRLSRRGAARLVRAGLLLVAAGTLAGFWAQAPYTSGAGLLDVSGAELRQVLTSDFGLVLAARLGIVALVAALLPPVLTGRSGPAGPSDRASRSDRADRSGPAGRSSRVGRVRGWLLVALGLAGLATWPLAGHAAASPVPVASGIADVVHLAAMSVWLGGLVTLVCFPLRAAHPRVLAVMLPVWSRWATIAVLWLVGAGVVLAVIEIGAPDALLGTGYGRLVLAKLALLALLLGAAGYARRLVRRRATAPSGTAPADPVSRTTAPSGTAPADPVAGRRRLRRTVGLEVLVGLVVLGVSSVLVQTTPGRNAGIEAEIAASDSFAQTLHSPLYTLQFDVYPVQLGPYNTVHAYVYTPDGKPLPAVEWTVTAALPAQGVEPTETPMLGVEPHHAVGAVNFPIPGDWELRFTVRTSEIDQATVRTVVRVR